VSLPTAPADVLGIDIADGVTLTIALTTGAGTAYARTDLTLAERAAIPHVNAIWGHDGGVVWHDDVVRGMLRRAITALGYGPPVVVIRPGDAPAFWLQIERDGRTRDLGLGVLDAVAQLIGDRLDVVVEVDQAHVG